MQKQQWIAVTSGEPAGVGPELCLQIVQRARQLQDEYAMSPVVLGSQALLTETALQLGMPVQFRAWDSHQAPQEGVLDVMDIPLAAPVQTGRLNAGNAQYVLNLLDAACAGCLDGTFVAMVTAPVHKGVINEAGHAFTGHTEYLADLTNTPLVVMMLAGGPLRVALATTHLPLREVPLSITKELLESVLRILHGDMRKKYGIAEPRILVAGLNPHAGEGGYLGSEEIEVITPVLEKLQKEGMLVQGPYPADTMFTPPILRQGDCVLAMYHDQGLTALKYATFGHGINVTLGLPIIRTSVDHGTALELAGKGLADPGSLFEALDQAAQMASRQKTV